MDYTEFTLNVSPAYLDEFYAKKTVLRLKKKIYRRRIAAGTSLAAVLAVSTTAGLWHQGEGGGFGEASLPLLQNPSYPDTPDEETDTETVLPEESTEPMDWETIMLNAVYSYNFSEKNEEEQSFGRPEEKFVMNWETDRDFDEAQGIITETDDPAEDVQPERVYYYAAVIQNIYVKGYSKIDAYSAADKEEKRLLAEYRQELESLEKLMQDYQTYENRHRAKIRYDQIMNYIESEKQKIIDAADEEAGREILFSHLEELGIKVFTRNITVYQSRAESTQTPVQKTLYLCYLTPNQINTLKDFINNSEDYRIELNQAYICLREQNDVFYRSDYEYFPY